MLRQTNKEKCLIYPPHRNLVLSWDKLVAMTADINVFHYLDSDSKEWYQSIGRTVLKMPPLQVIHGSLGGGIIVSDERDTMQPSPLWLVCTSQLLIMSQPSGMLGGNTDGHPIVSVLENRPGIKHLSQDKTVSVEKLSVTAEHINVAEGCIYYVFDFSGKQIERDMCSQIEIALNYTGVQVVACQSPPAHVLSQCTDWFLNPKRRQVWVQVSSANDSAKFHVAVVTYISIHFKARWRGLANSHVVASMETEKCYRRKWPTIVR